LPDLLRRLRHDQWEAGFIKSKVRWGIGLWSWFAARPALYRVFTRLAVAVLGRMGRSAGRFRRLPLASGWTAGRDMPAPQGTTFHAAWAKRNRQQ